jgi:hypothetical protein
LHWRLNYRTIPFPRPSGVLRTSGFPRASGFPGRRAVCRSGSAGADGDGLRLRRKLAAEKDCGRGSGDVMGRGGVVFPNANPFCKGDASLGPEGCACIKSVNTELNCDVFSAPTSVGARDTNNDSEPSVSWPDNTNLNPGQWARKQVPRPMDSGPLTTRTPLSAARSCAKSEAAPPWMATRRFRRPPTRSRTENGRPASVIGAAESFATVMKGSGKWSCDAQGGATMSSVGGASSVLGLLDFPASRARDRW